MGTSRIPDSLRLDQVKGLWRQQLRVAKLAWGKLTDDELVELDGDEVKLAGLIQHRYGCTRANAENQVSIFFESQETCPYCHQTIFPIRTHDSRVVSL